MTGPDDRPGSVDPEDPSELVRLIGRTVPRSPHAGGRAEDPASGPWDGGPPAPQPAVRVDEERAEGPAEHGGAQPSPAGPARELPAAPDELAGQRPEEPAGERPEEPAGERADEPAGERPEEPAGERADEPAGERADEPAGERAEGTAGLGDAEPEPVEEELPPGELDDDSALEHALEALLLVVDDPVDESSLGSALDQPPSRIRAALNRMSLAYTADARGIDLRRAGEGWRFYTRDRYAPYVERMLLDGQRARLTRAALETLAVVAYRQPVTRARVSAVRGVNCDGVLRTLLTRGLVEEAGTEEQTGGTLFRTTELFLERLGLSSVAELPPLAPLLPDIDAIDDLED